MSSPRIVVVSIQGRDSLPADGAERLEQQAEVVYLSRSEPMTAADARAAFREAGIVAVTPKVSPTFDDRLLSQLPELRTIVLHATGFEAFDLDILTRHGVQLLTLPSYSTESVAAHAVGLMLAMSTRLHLANDRSRELVPPLTSLRGFELAGRTLGIVGLGRIGSRVAGMAFGLGMRVVANDIEPRFLDGVEMTGLPSLLAQADVVSLNCPRAHDAPPMIGTAQLARMRPGAVLVNVSRAELVDNDAVVAELRHGRLRGYAVDDAVFLSPDTLDLRSQGRILQTGHSAWWTDEVLERGGHQWAEALVAALDELESGPLGEAAALS